MASLFDSVVAESKIYKGASRVVIAPATADGGPSFPSKIEDVIDLSMFVVASRWTDLGATTRDGVKVTRTVEMEEGVDTDRLAASILKGYPKKWEGQASFTWLHTDVDSLKIAFEADEPSAVEGSEGDQKELKFGSPTSLTERQFCVIQKHSRTNKYRMIALRRVIKSAEEIELAFQSEDATRVAMAFDMLADTGQAVGSNFGSVFEMTSAI